MLGASPRTGKLVRNRRSQMATWNWGRGPANVPLAAGDLTRNSG